MQHCHGENNYLN